MLIDSAMGDAGCLATMRLSRTTALGVLGSDSLAKE